MHFSYKKKLPTLSSATKPNPTQKVYWHIDNEGKYGDRVEGP